MRKLMLMAAAVVLLGMTVKAEPDRDTPQKAGGLVALVAGEALPAGVLAGVWTNGLAYAAGVSKALAVIGRTEGSAVSGGRVMVQRGVFRWDAGDAVALKDIGATVYVWTNTAYTVCLTKLAAAATNAVGKVFDVDTNGVWVRSGY